MWLGIKVHNASGAIRSAEPVLTLYSVTHPSYTSDVGPTACVFSRYVDVVPVCLWVVLPETDGRLLVEVANSQLDDESVKSVYTGNGALSVQGKM